MSVDRVRIKGIFRIPKGRTVRVKDAAMGASSRENLVDARGLSNAWIRNGRTGLGEPRSLINGKR